jgi:hypothetical protein
MVIVMAKEYFSCRKLNDKEAGGVLFGRQSAQWNQDVF